MTPERKVKEQVKEMLKDAGYWYFMPVAGRGTMGIPDIIGCAPNGKFLAIECKATGGMLTPLQDKVLRDIMQHGGYTFVAWPSNLDHLQKLIDSIK
jgi:Holliday junction resolvase